MKNSQESELQSSDGVQPIMVKSKLLHLYSICMSCFIGGKESTVQRQAVLPIWRNEDCNDAYFQPITSNFICAGYAHGGTDACQVVNDLFKACKIDHYKNFILIREIPVVP